MHLDMYEVTYNTLFCELRILSTEIFLHVLLLTKSEYRTTADVVEHHTNVQADENFRVMLESKKCTLTYK